MSTSFFILLMDVLTAERLLAMISFFLSLIFIGHWEVGRERNFPSAGGIVSVREFFFLKSQIMSSQFSKSCDTFEVSLT